MLLRTLHKENNCLKSKNFFLKLVFKAITTSSLTCLFATIYFFNKTASAGPITSSGSLNVTTSITPTCSISSTSLVFEAYVPANDTPALEGTPAPLIVNCGSGTIFTIKVDTNQDSGN